MICKVCHQELPVDKFAQKWKRLKVCRACIPYFIYVRKEKQRIDDMTPYHRRINQKTIKKLSKIIRSHEVLEVRVHAHVALLSVEIDKFYRRLVGNQHEFFEYFYLDDLENLIELRYCIEKIYNAFKNGDFVELFFYMYHRNEDVLKLMYLLFEQVYSWELLSDYQDNFSIPIDANMIL